MAKAKQPVSINGIEFDALISEEHTLEATLPQYAVEDGFSVTDAIILGEERVSMVLYVTNTPVTWYSKHGGDQARVDTVCAELEDLYFKKTPVTVVTTDRTYTDMAIESISFNKTVEEGYSREVPISLMKVRKTAAKTTTIPASYGKSGKTGAGGGSANTSSKSSGSGGSGSSSSSSSKSSSSSSSSSSGSGGTKGSLLWNAGHSLGLF